VRARAKKKRFQQFIKVSTTNTYILTHLFIIYTYIKSKTQTKDQSQATIRLKYLNELRARPHLIELRNLYRNLSAIHYIFWPY